MCKVAESPKKLHILAADDTGAAEKNIINKDLGILDDFGILTEYKGNGSGEYKMPHILFHTSGGDKIIFVVGYGNKSKWKDALGGQYGCLYIDEINTANIEFVREASMRCDYLMATLNPDDPSLDVYKEYINCSRPLRGYQDKARTVLTAEKKLVQITGTALFPGDICPELPVISGGSAEIFGVKRRIEQGTKARNPDGSVNYTEVILV